MPKVSPEALEVVAHKELNAQMAWIEELFAEVRAHSLHSPASQLTTLRNVLEIRIRAMGNFLDEYEIRYH